jgi:hypothetical protein
MPDIVDFPKDVVVVENAAGERRTYVRDLEKTLDKCYEQFNLPSEASVSWAAPGYEIATAGLFPAITSCAAIKEE